MASNNPFIVVLLYPDCRMRNSDKGVPFECQDPILFRTQHVETLSDLKSLILSKVGGTQARKIRRVAYRLLAPMGNRIFRFRLFRLHGDEHVRLMFDIHGRIMCEHVMELSAEVGYGGSGSSIHETYVQDDRPFAPPPIYVAIPEHEGEEGEEKSDEDYVADSESSDDGDEDEFVPETPAGAVPSHYHSLHLDVMHERNPVQRFGGQHTCLTPTMSQDYCQLDSSLICRVILPLIQSNPTPHSARPLHVRQDFLGLPIMYRGLIRPAEPPKIGTDTSRPTQPSPRKRSTLRKVPQ
ncbi:hypothetical protein Ahy_A01g000427 [Arachis hypogaea]|uniref:Uncharacterized protein n=1 Tax=Arachis hypogaea TaxID=3818 RepID=A0A445EKE7_ARAHY|nr:hypothetical protein Ahy_A01g000427 [Arachis hypogaea]